MRAMRGIGVLKVDYVSRSQRELLREEQWPTCGACEINFLDLLGSFSSKIHCLSYNSVIPGMHADVSTGKSQVQIMFEPPTFVEKFNFK